MSGVPSELVVGLFAMQDASYRDFQCALMPTVDPATVIGVRTPALRRFAKELRGTPQASAFLQALPHRYYEENNLHAFLIEQLGNYDATIAALDRFLPFVDNWATCDMMRPKIFAAHREELLLHIPHWLSSDHPYTVRFGIEMLMVFYLDDAHFRSEYLQWVADVSGEDYYVRMMVAWYFATALAMQYDAALPYLRNNRLEIWTHNKAIQKAVESRRLTDAQKNDLRKLRRKSLSFGK
jgi:3-methyladenine DNA glycosylase AlkD